MEDLEEVVEAAAAAIAEAEGGPNRSDDAVRGDSTIGAAAFLGGRVGEDGFSVTLLLSNSRSCTLLLLLMILSLSSALSRSRLRSLASGMGAALKAGGRGTSCEGTATGSEREGVIGAEDGCSVDAERVERAEESSRNSGRKLSEL